MNRRNFIQQAGLLSTWLGVSVVLHGCSNYGDDDNPTDPGNGGTGSVSGVITSNHGHSVAVTSAQLTAGGSVELALSVGNGHAHAVTLSAAEVVLVAGGNQVQVTSTSGGGHTHSVTFN